MNLLFIALALCVLFLAVRFSIFLPAIKGVPVLLYHKVSLTHEDSLTIKPSAFEKHLAYLVKKGYHTISVKELIGFIERKAPLPPKPVMITFDDGYVNNFELAYPLLKRYGCKAVFFIPSAGIGKTNWWDRLAEPLMNVDQLLGLDTSLIEIGLHSTDHKHYGKILPEQIEVDMHQSISAFRHSGIPFVPAFAYPYGGRPKNKENYAHMVRVFSSMGIKLAFRIGNRVNKLPLKNYFEVKRISIQGSDSMWTFKTKLLKGREKQI
jgi:Predicted xylanase/chitin deacetylase